VVNNDSSNLGVQWRVINSCGNDDCGSISKPHSNSGEPVTYNPPATMSSNSLTVKILAYAVADSSKNVMTRVTVTAFSNVLKGKYVLQASGVDSNPDLGIFGVAYFAAAVVLDGNGGVLSGEQTYTNTTRSASGPITGGSYFVGPDGRGSLTLNTPDQTLGQVGVEFFSIVVLSSSQVMILKNDLPNSDISSAFESFTGTMELQTNVAPLSHGYAFVLTGTDIASVSPSGVGGVLNVDSPNTISGTGSISDQDLPTFTVFLPNNPTSGTVSDPDGFGVVKFNLSTAFSITPVLFSGYIVDATHIRLIETDVDGTNLTGAAAAGVAIGQGASTGTFSSSSALAGNFLFGIFGQDISGFPATFTSAGTFTATPTTALAGTLTPGFNEAFFDLLSISVVDQFKGSYKIDKTGTGRVDAKFKYKQLINNGGAGAPEPEYIIYLTGNGTPALVLDVDANGQLFTSTGVGTGFVYAVTTPLSLNGNYATRFTQNNSGSIVDFAGTLTVNGSAQTLNGTLDTNNGFNNAGPTTLTGNFAPSPNMNVFSGTLSDSNAFIAPNGSGIGINVDFYLTDPSHGFFIENDLNDPNVPSSAVAFGQFAARTPICASCP
jgi:hypothetical protein